MPRRDPGNSPCSTAGDMRSSITGFRETTSVPLRPTRLNPRRSRWSSRIFEHCRECVCGDQQNEVPIASQGHGLSAARWFKAALRGCWFGARARPAFGFFRLRFMVRHQCENQSADHRALPGRLERAF